MRLPDLTQIPIWYIAIAVVFSIYYGWRGGRANYLVAVGQKKDTGKEGIFKYLTEKQIFRIYSLHDFIFHFLCSISGFLALYILSQCRVIKSTEDSIFIIFLSLYSIVGITDTLPQLLPLGKFPGK
jgi:hypothetical protein